MYTLPSLAVGPPPSQISGSIWLVNETGFTGFEVDQCKHPFGHNLADLQWIATKFGQVNLFQVQVWLLR